MVAPIVLAILTGLATAGFINLTTKDDAKTGDTTIFSEGQPVLTVPSTTISQDIPYSSIKATFVRVTTSDTSKPSTPNVRIVNAIDNNRIIGLSLVGDATFLTEGEAVVSISNSDLLTVQKASFTDLGALDVPFTDNGLALVQSSTIDTFVWNTDGNAVNLTVLIVTGVKQGVA